MFRRRTSGSARIVATAILVAMVVGVLAPGAAAAAPGKAARPAAGPGTTVKVLVRFKERPGRAGANAIRDAGGTVRYRFRIVPAIAATVPVKALDGIRRNPRVAGIELDGRLTAFDHAGNTGDLEYENAWGVEHIGSKPVHDAGIRGTGIRVAVIDTGIDYLHNMPPALEPPVVDPEFNGTYRGGYDFVNGDADPLDDNGHGTHVSGILAADHNGYLVVGVAPGVDLYALKVLGANGEGDYSGLIAALDWAVAHDIDVVNMSLGGHEVSATLEAAVRAAAGAGTVLVAAAGNVNPGSIQELLYGCPVAYPAAYPEVLATTFTNGTDQLTGFSCTGVEVDFAAPGDQVFSPVPAGPSGSCMFCNPNGYAALSGTSMASPHLAGLVALVLDHGILDANHDGLLADDVKAHLCANTNPGGRIAQTDPRYPKWYGCGVIDAAQALLVNPPPPPQSGGTPVAVDDGATTPEDSPVDIAVLANDSDPEGDPLSVTAVSTPAHGTASLNGDGTVRYLPAPDYNGPDAFTYTLDDGAGHSAAGSVGLTVTPVNDQPVAAPDTLVTSRDIASTIDVLANDSDVDGDPLAVSDVTSPANGTVTIGAGGALTYTPAPGYDGPDAFTYTVSDGAGGFATGQVDVTVLEVNSPPVAAADEATTPEDTPAWIDVVANDIDADGGALVVIGVDAAAHGSTAVDPNGTVRYTPAANFHGSDAFTYTVADGAGATAIGSVTVEVTPVNDAPVAVPDSAATPEDTAITIDLAANDTDVDGDALAVVAVGTPVLGSAAVSGGKVVYTPGTNLYGTDSFGYTVGDLNGGTAQGIVTVTVTPVNDPPTAAPKSATTNYRTAVTITLTGSDVETCDLGFQVVTPPANGTLTSPSSVLCVTLLPPYSDSSKVTYTPASGFSGTDTFTYRTSDGSATSAPATVTVTVRPAVQLHVGDLDGTRSLQTSSWTAKVTIRVHDGVEASTGGVTVTGTWSVGGSGSCKTSSGGTCTISKSGIAKTALSATFTVTGLTLTSGVYVPGANHDPDGDSDGTRIVISQR